MACVFKRLLSEPNNIQYCIRGVASRGFITWRCNTVLNTLINSLDVRFYWSRARLVDRVLYHCWRL